MTADSQTQSLNYVQGYAVKDRVDYSCYSDKRSGEINLFDILPTPADYSSLKEDFSVTVSRIIFENLLFFQENFQGLVQQHVPHKFSTEQSKKSEVVSTLPDM